MRTENSTTQADLLSLIGRTMSFFKAKVDIKSISLLIRDNNRKVHIVETQRKQKTDGVIFRIFVLEID